MKTETKTFLYGLSVGILSTVLVITLLRIKINGDNGSPALQSEAAGGRARMCRQLTVDLTNALNRYNETGSQADWETMINLAQQIDSGTSCDIDYVVCGGDFQNAASSAYSSGYLSFADYTDYLENCDDAAGGDGNDSGQPYL